MGSRRRGAGLVVALGLVAAACGDDDGASQPEVTAQPAEDTTTTTIDDDRVAVSMPTSVAPPPAGGGVPYASAMVAGAAGADEMATHGYVEEEFIVAGSANVYRYGADGEVEVDREGVSYATRILIRRPSDPEQFSGRVQVETSHPQYGINVVWSQTYDHLLASGDAYVSIATRRTSNGSSAIDGMQGFDPARYEPIEFSEDGLTWDIIGQVGVLLKAATPDNPLREFDVERVYASGWSGGGALLLLFISDGFHDRYRMPDGSPAYDGYLVGEPSGYPRINSTASELPTSDERQQVQPREVPAISLHTRPQEEHRRRPDSDEPGDRYRVYVVAGASHADARTIGGGLDCDHDVNAFPMHHLFKSTLERLDAWATEDVRPPPSQRLTLDSDGSVALDEHGNPLGGVRTTYTEIPVARYLAENSGDGACNRFGGQEPFAPAKLASLYGSHADYVQRVERMVAELEHDGWLLPADADAVRAEAALVTIP